MDEFTARKLGEVLAFAQVGRETYERGKAALAETIGAVSTLRIMEENGKHADEILVASAEADITRTVMSKAEATAEKLRRMRDLYLKEEDWNNPTEILEWLGFFEGAAVVHWSLVQASAEKIGSSAIRDLSGRAAKLHYFFFRSVSEGIKRMTVAHTV